MILLTEISTREEAPDFISDGEGVWRYSFGGDETYTDVNGTLFYWGGRVQAFDVRGVSLGATNYLEVSSVANCIAQVESFYWDDDAKTLYVHHADEVNDYTLDRAIYRVLLVAAGYSTGKTPGRQSYYPDLYFDPRLVDIGQLTKRVDPLKFGLLSFASSRYSLANADGALDDFSLGEALNSQVRFVLMPDDETDIDNGQRIFTGYTGGAQRSDESLSVTLQEARRFYDREVCPSTFDLATYASLAEQWVGARIPVAYGEIRRGIAIPIDTASFDKASGGTVTFKLADDSLHAIRAVDKLFDNDGNEVTKGTINLTACTVQFAVPADADLDLDGFSWAGEGYDIPGTFDNGLDIMKDAFAEQASVVYSSDSFVTTEWEDETIIHDESVGISVQSSGGIISELIEPITVSLQGIVDVLGDGRITFRSRDPDRSISGVIFKDELLGEPSIEIATEEVVSSIVIEYGTGWAPGSSSLRTEYAESEDDVLGNYGVKNTKPVSPILTSLATESDALGVGASVDTTSSEPQTFVAFTFPLTENVPRLLDIVQVDIGRVGEEVWLVGEVLEHSFGISGDDLVVGMLVRELPDREAIEVGYRITDDRGLRITDDGRIRGTDTT